MVVDSMDHVFTGDLTHDRANGAHIDSGLVFVRPRLFVSPSPGAFCRQEFELAGFFGVCSSCGVDLVYDWINMVHGSCF